MDTLNSDATQGTQQAFNLYAVGYFEPLPSEPSYPYLPLPELCVHCGAPDPGIGPRQIWHSLRERSRTGTFVSELIWREFAYHLLHHFPDTPERP